MQQNFCLSVLQITYLEVQRDVTHVVGPAVVVPHGLVEADAESAEKNLTVHARGDPLPQRSEALLAGNSGQGAEHTGVLGGDPRRGRPLELHPHLGGVERQGAQLRE